jgi:peptide subunit release factor 1 (eRF1)
VDLNDDALLAAARAAAGASNFNFDAFNTETQNKYLKQARAAVAAYFIEIQSINSDDIAQSSNTLTVDTESDPGSWETALQFSQNIKVVGDE